MHCSSDGMSRLATCYVTVILFMLKKPVYCLQLDSKCNILNDQMFRSNSSAEYIARASKVVTLVDLAGHERYFKTTAYGLTGHMPDYACLIVGANAGQ